MAVVQQRPPHTRRKHAVGVIVGDHARIGGDANATRESLIARRPGDRGVTRVGRVSDFVHPVDEDRARDVRLQPVIAMVEVVRRRLAGRNHMATNVDDAQIRVIQMLLQPVRRDQQIILHGAPSEAGVCACPSAQPRAS